MNRRDFLKLSGLTLLGAAVPRILPAFAQSQPADTRMGFGLLPMPDSSPPALHVNAAVDVDLLAGDVVAFGGEERNRLGHLFR